MAQHNKPSDRLFVQFLCSFTQFNIDETRSKEYTGVLLGYAAIELYVKVHGGPGRCSWTLQGFI